MPGGTSFVNDWPAVFLGTGNSSRCGRIRRKRTGGITGTVTGLAVAGTAIIVLGLFLK